MSSRSVRSLAPAALVLAFVQFGCGESSPSGPAPPPQPGPDAVPAFSWPDVNATSPRSGDAVSPRDYLGQVSGWYFGHAT